MSGWLIMNSKCRLRKSLSRLRDKAVRDAFVASEVETLLPFQIRAMRQERGWSQQELAARAGMRQARISVLENPSYEGAINVQTLVKLASAFDVALVVRFAPFSELVSWASQLSEASHNVPEFEAEWMSLTEADIDAAISAPTLTMRASNSTHASAGANLLHAEVPLAA